MSEIVRIRASRRVRPCLVLLLSLFLIWPASSQASETASHTDVARFLAGMQPAEGSPLKELTKTGGWKVHSRAMDRAWKTVEKNQLSHIRKWRDANLTSPGKTLFYMFSGPDYLYANAFFPEAETIVMAGLELVGYEPELLKISRSRRNNRLIRLRGSLNTLMRSSYFITAEMSKNLSGRGFTGTLPVIYVFLARAGKTIHDVSHFAINDDGSLEKLEGDAIKKARASKITFSDGKGGTQRTLYYFRTDLSDKGIAAKGGFLKFLGTLGKGDVFVKSASYLLHYATFSNIRNFLMANAQTILQDDTGIKLSYFKKDEWEFEPHGRYNRPIPVFRARYQRDMARLFQKSKAKPIKFGVGYARRSHRSNILIARKKIVQAIAEKPAVEEAPAKEPIAAE